MGRVTAHRGRPQPIDEAEDFSEQLPRHRNLRQLESDVPAVAHDLGTNLDQLLPERGQRPVLHRLRQGQRQHEVAEVVIPKHFLITHYPQPV